MRSTRRFSIKQGRIFSSRLFILAKLIQRDTLSTTPSPPNTTSQLSPEDQARDQAFNQADVERDLAELKNRLDRIPNLADTDIFLLFKEWVNAMGANDARTARTYMNMILKELNAVKAFKVDRDFYLDTRRSPEELEAYGSQAKTKAQLWSKLDKFLPIDIAREQKGISLESSLGGSLFDGLMFGKQYVEGGLLHQQWKKISANYVRRTRGFMHVRVFRKLHPDSVFTKTEMPELIEMMNESRRNVKRMKIEGVIVHLYDFPGSDVGQMQEVDQIHVLKPGDFANLPMLQKGSDEEKAFKSAQGMVWRSEITRTQNLLFPSALKASLESARSSTAQTDFASQVREATKPLRKLADMNIAAWDKMVTDPVRVAKYLNKEEEGAMQILLIEFSRVGSDPELIKQELTAYLESYVVENANAPQENEEQAAPDLKPNKAIEEVEED